MKLKTLHEDTAGADIIAKSIREYLKENGYYTNHYAYPNSHILAMNTTEAFDLDKGDPIPPILISIEIDNDDLEIELNHYVENSVQHDDMEFVDIHNPDSLQRILAYVKKYAT